MGSVLRGSLKTLWKKNVVVFIFGVSTVGQAHDVITTKVTFDCEIGRLLNDHCNSCHHPDGSAFSLLTYSDARPWAKAIEEETLTRQMPPWGAVKGFGDFRNDGGLTPEQLELIVDWAEGGAPEGEEKDIPPMPTFSGDSPSQRRTDEIIVSGDLRLSHAVTLDGLWPVAVPDNAKFQIVAEFPDGSIEPLLWLQNYRSQFAHPFLLRTPLELPAGTWVRGVPAGATVTLLTIAVPRRQTVELLTPQGRD